MLRGPPRTLDIAVYLLDKDEVEVGKVMSDLDLANETFYSGIDRLRMLGFLHKRRERGYPPHSYVGLTNKGMEAARLLRSLADIVGSTILGLTGELEDLEGKDRGEDENKRMVEILCDLQDINFTLGEWDEAETHAKRSMDIASALGDTKNLSKSMRMLALLQYTRGVFDESESEFSESLKMSLKANDLSGVAEAQYYMGAINEDRGNYDEATAKYKESAETSQSAGEKALEARAKLALGRMYGKKGSYKDSMETIKESIRTFEELEQYDELPRAYANAGATAFYIDLDEALKWHEKSMETANRNSDLRMQGYSLSNLAGVYNKKGEPKKALVYLERALEISEKLDEKRMICSINIQKGCTHRLVGELNEADRYFGRAVQVAQDFELPYELGDGFLNWAYVDIDRGNDREAKDKLKQALDAFDKLGNQARVNKVRNVLRTLSTR
ncbi:MAG: tetratricopeptide repeat protein [Thermoplasmata archaeon]